MDWRSLAVSRKFAIGKGNDAMTEPDNLVLIYLRRIDEKVDRVIADVADLKIRVTDAEEGQAGIHRRLGRVEMRLDYIERRFDLVELPH
jgi:hypothetical protein